MLPMARRKQMELGPATMVSGFLTKRTRTLDRWKRRWWQLMDNGTLLYFKDEDRIKLLGEIDIARTCYDVRLGAETCKVKFPRVAASCCCFAFSVLKRSYYMYAPTAAEAKRWVECIRSVALVLNQKQIFRTRRPAPQSPRQPRAPSCPPNFHIDDVRRRRTSKNAANRNKRHSAIVQDTYRRELQDEPTDLPVFARRKLTHKHTSSVPNLYTDRCVDSPHRGSSTPNSKLWLDGSPHNYKTHAMRGQEMTSAVGVQTHSLSGVSSPLSVQTQHSMFSSFGNDLDKLLHCHSPLEPDLDSHGGTLPRVKQQEKRKSLPATFTQEFMRLQAKEAQIRRRLDRMDLPRRPASVADHSSLYQGKHNRHSVAGVPVLPGLIHVSGSSEKLTSPKSWKEPPPVKPKPIHMRAPKGSRRKEPSFVVATRILQADSPTEPERLSPTESETSTSITTAPITQSAPPPQTDGDSPPLPIPSRASGGPPKFVPPPPPSDVSETSPSHDSTDCRAISELPESTSPRELPRQTSMFWGCNGRKSSQTRAVDANNWAHAQLQKVSLKNHCFVPFHSCALTIC